MPRVQILHLGLLAFWSIIDPHLSIVLFTGRSGFVS